MSGAPVRQENTEVPGIDKDSDATISTLSLRTESAASLPGVALGPAGVGFAGRGRGGKVVIAQEIDPMTSPRPPA